MRLHAVLVVGLLFVAGSGIASAQPAPAGEPDFKAMMRKTLAAWQSMKPASAAPLYAKDATLAFYDAAPLKFTGWSEYEKGSTATFAGFTSLKMTLSDDIRTQRRGDMAFGTATLRADVGMKDGSKLGFDGRWTVIWEKRGAEWLIVHEHLSAPLPDVATPAPK